MTNPGDWSIPLPSQINPLHTFGGYDPIAEVLMEGAQPGGQTPPFISSNPSDVSAASLPPLTSRLNEPLADVFQFAMPFTTDLAYGGSAARCADKPATVALAPTASAAVTHSEDPAVISASQALLGLETDAGTSNVLEDDPSRRSSSSDLASSGDQTNLFPPPPDVAPGHQQAPPQQPSQLPVHPPSSFSHPLPPPFGPAFLASAANTVPPSVAPADLAASVHHACGYGPVQPPDDEPEPIVTAVRVISDRIAAANPEVMRHKFEMGAWILTYFKVKGDDDIDSGAEVAVDTGSDAVDVDKEADQDEYEATVTVPVKVTTTTAGLVDLKWEASLIPMTPKQLKKVVNLDQLIVGSKWSALRATGSVDAGKLTQTGARTLPLTMTFNVTPLRKHLLVVVVNGIVVNGLPKEVTVRCDRQARRVIKLKRKAASAPGDEEDDTSDLPESSPAPVAKRAKMTAVDKEIAELIAHLVSAQNEQAVTPPPSPQLGPHFCPEVALWGMLETAAAFNPMIFNLLRAGKFQVEAIHNATSLLIEKHIRGGANSLWSEVQIVETFALLGDHADVIRPYFWTSTVAYPDPLHALAHCTRPDLVAAMFEYLHRRQVPAPVLAPCPQSSYLSHKPMGCDSCRAFATNVALSRANASGFLPIHVAAWKKNSIFVEHHLRIMGAKSTFAAANQRDGDGGNFFHATCGSKSAVEWLEKLWGEVILDVTDREVVAHALQMEDDCGRTPLDMAKFQVEMRKETANGTKKRTLQWVKDKIAMFA